MRNKKSKPLKNLEDVLVKDNRFYSNINIIRFIIRWTSFSLISILLYVFKFLSLSEMLLIFMALIIIEFIKYNRRKNN